MSKISEANFKVQGNFYPGADGPFDARTMVDDVADLTNANTWKADAAGTIDATLFNGMPVTVANTGDLYVLKNKNRVDLPESWKKVGSDVPTVKHELIYSEDGSTLTTRQLMHEHMLIVDNQADLEECKGFVNVSPKEIANTWRTEVFSTTPIGINEATLYPGGIASSSNGFWSYNSLNDTIDATFNDNTYSRRAIIHNPANISGSTMEYDGLSGYYTENPVNDEIGVAFVGYDDTPMQDESGNTYYRTVVLKIGGEPRVANGNFITNTTVFSVHKRKTKKSDDKQTITSTSGNNPSDRYYQQGSITGFGVVGGTGNAYVDETATSVETGKYVIKPTYINWPNDWKKAGDEDRIAYIRLYVKKQGNTITWQVSQVTEGNPTDVTTEKPDLIRGVKVIFDMDSYEVRYITPEMSNYKTYSCIAFKEYIDILKGDCHFGFCQASTETGRFYNIDSVGTVPILDVSTDKVWVPTGESSNPWSVETGTTPIDYFYGSHTAYNDITKKLWYSNGRDIYQVADICGCEPTPIAGDYLPLSGGTMTSGSTISFGDGGFIGYMGDKLTLSSGDNRMNIIGEEKITIKAQNSDTKLIEVDADALVPPSGVTGMTVGSSSQRFSSGYFNNSVHAASGFFQDSDSRKKDVSGELSLDKAYDLIDKCSTILYTLKDDPKQREQVGLIAQDVEEFFPEIVATDSEGFKSLDYSRLTVILLRVLKDLVRRVDRLEGYHTVYG